MSCMEKPRNFLNQLKDDGLILKKRYKTLIEIEEGNKVQREKGLYDMLEWLEEEQSDNIKQIWKCVFKEHLRNEYRTLRNLHQKLQSVCNANNRKLQKGMKRKSSQQEDEEGEKQHGTGSEASSSFNEPLLKVVCGELKAILVKEMFDEGGKGMHFIRG
ncbi:hypothetical protein UPYG_G00096390 [Umbra pygmaea]|uniref:HSR domain-containing protein n=1 Tax=Umbra pygmaea TaxID=75934 RepID=A0ABD0X3Y8_UMBPY